MEAKKHNTTDLRHPLSPVYAPWIFMSAMDIWKDDNTRKRTRNIVLSSPVMSAFFDKIRECFIGGADDSDNLNFYSLEYFDEPRPQHAIHCTIKMPKQGTFFSWKESFKTELFLDVETSNKCELSWAYDIVPQLCGFSNGFGRSLPNGCTNAVRPSVTSFIRRHPLQELSASIEFFLELPQSPSEPKKMYLVSIGVRRFSDFLTLFNTKRFISNVILLDFGMDYASNLTTFLQNTAIRMPETRMIQINLPDLSPRFPVAEMIQALYTVFPGIKHLIFRAIFPAQTKVTSYDRVRLENDFAHILQELEKTPPQIHAEFYFRECVQFVDKNIAMSEFETPPPNGFQLLRRSKLNERLFVNTNSCDNFIHGNKTVTYFINFSY